ncbi:solute carrier family 22 member 8 [Elysia marginata]|uniref:Solute carrier family 22 member 8 n=1 Tax=Elysia marginata TaxID=1093978 RepID=A0AAV4F008_9GAST|nr:solute carrier family 22 member 8 [Elysia marginata]
MTTAFWDTQGIFLVDFLSRGETVNSDSYIDTLKRLRARILRARPDMDSENVLLLHDNARPNTSTRTRETIATFGWTTLRLPHPSYSPVLAPSDFNLFGSMKQGMVPDWFCVTPESESLDERSFIQFIKNDSFSEERYQECFVTNSSQCTNFRFLGPYMTVTEEWTLVCDRNWVRSTLISVQMTGMLLGCLVAGQLGDQFGRRRVLNAYTLGHALVNIGAAFTNSWQLFAVTRFLIGAGIGGIITIAFPYGLEFLPLKWRPFTATFPFWGAGVAIFTGVAYFLPDWRNLHLALGILNIPCLIGYWKTPESIRWLAAKGKKDEAEAVLQKMADTNGKPLPPHTGELLETV